MAQKKLKQYFPIIRQREKLLKEIKGNPKLRSLYYSWTAKQRQEFLDFCTGARGLKILYDSFFKEVMNPEYTPERLEQMLCAILNRKVRIIHILPNDSTRIADETSLLITDIVVELDDGSLANVEIQKIGYSFPGPRSACYAADMLLRQYKRVRKNKGDSFSYNDIKTVFLIIIYEKSPSEFHEHPDTFYHHSRQVFDSGLKLDLLQEFVMIPLDIFRKNMHNKTITTPFQAWMTFLSEDEPEKIIELIETFPEFKPMYETLYQMCLNTERVMELFSEELRMLDRNTVKYMIEQQAEQLAKQAETIALKDEAIALKDEAIASATKQLTLKDEAIASATKQLTLKDETIALKDEAIASATEQLTTMSAENDDLKQQLAKALQKLDELSEKL